MFVKKYDPRLGRFSRVTSEWQRDWRMWWFLWNYHDKLYNNLICRMFFMISEYIVLNLWQTDTLSIYIFFTKAFLEQKFRCCKNKLWSDPTYTFLRYFLHTGRDGQIWPFRRCFTSFPGLWGLGEYAFYYIWYCLLCINDKMNLSVE